MAAAHSSEHHSGDAPGDRTGELDRPAAPLTAPLERELPGIGIERSNFVRRLARFGLGEHPYPLLARLLFHEPRK